MVRLNGRQRTGVNLLARTTHLYQPRDARGEDGMRYLGCPPPGYESGAWVRHVEVQVDARDPRGRGQRCLSPVGGPRERRGNTIPYTIDAITRLKAAGRTEGHNRVLGRQDGTEVMAFKADLLSGTRHGELVPMLATATASDYTLNEQTWTEQDLAMQDAIDRAARHATQAATQVATQVASHREAPIGTPLTEPVALGQLNFPSATPEPGRHDHAHNGHAHNWHEHAAHEWDTQDEEWLSL